MKSLCKFEPLDLLSLMIKYMYKTVIEHKGNHIMGYGYFPTKVFHHFNIHTGVGRVSTTKQMFTQSTLVEYECDEEKGNILSKVSQLIKEHDQLKHELEAIIVLVSNKKADIALTKEELLKAQTQGPGTEIVQKLHK